MTTNQRGNGAHRGQRATGATLLEAMITLVIVAILMSLGIPGMIDFVRNARRDSQVSDLVVALNYARSEAIKRGHQVTLCPSLDGHNCNGDMLWETGWIVFADPNTNGIVDNGELVMRAREATSSGGTVRSGKRRLTYQRDGFSTGFNDTLRVCDQRGTAEARSVIVSMQGRVRVASQASACP